MGFIAYCEECSQNVCVEMRYTKASEARDDHFDETGHIVTVEQA